MPVIATIILCLSSTAAGSDYVFVQLPDGRYVGMLLSGDGVELLEPADSVAVLDLPGPPEPTAAGQLICIRPWSCTVDEADEILTIREALDDAKSDIPYLVCLPGILNEDMEPHPTIAAYRNLVEDRSKPWIFHVAPTARGPPRILHQGPPDADTVLGWVGLQKPQRFFAQPANEERWLDVEFDKVAPTLCGALPPDIRVARFNARLAGAADLDGLRPIPRSEWSQWTERFPVERMAANIRHISKQVMGSCVGHSSMNSVEGAEHTLAGDLFFRRLSAMSMYRRVGTRPNSGAYVGTAADRIFTEGILPADGEINADSNPYPHTHQIAGDFYDNLPNGWKSTAKAWRCEVVRIETRELAYRWMLDCGLRIHYGRRGHAISAFTFTRSNRTAYENSWGTGWGDLGKSVGYDSDWNAGYGYRPVLRDELAVVEARELNN